MLEGFPKMASVFGKSIIVSCFDVLAIHIQNFKGCEGRHFCVF